MSLVRDVNAIGIRRLSPREALLAEKARDPAAVEAASRPRADSAFAAGSGDQSFGRLEERIAALEQALIADPAAPGAIDQLQPLRDAISAQAILLGEMAAKITALEAAAKPKHARKPAQKMSDAT